MYTLRIQLTCLSDHPPTVQGPHVHRDYFKLTLCLFSLANVQTTCYRDHHGLDLCGRGADNSQLKGNHNPIQPPNNNHPISIQMLGIHCFSFLYSFHLSTTAIGMGPEDGSIVLMVPSRNPPTHTGPIQEPSHSLQSFVEFLDTGLEVSMGNTTLAADHVCLLNGLLCLLQLI